MPTPLLLTPGCFPALCSSRARKRPLWLALSDLLHLKFIYFNYSLLKASMFQELPRFMAPVLRPAQLFLEL